jgi:hypothetical protein
MHHDLAAAQRHSTHGRMDGGGELQEPQRITGILGSLLGLDLIIPLIICIIFFICGAVVCFKAIGEK